MIVGAGRPARVLLVAFVLHARRDHALIDISLFRDRAFAAASGTVFIFGVSLFGAMLILPLYYQVVRGGERAVGGAAAGAAGGGRGDGDADRGPADRPPRRGAGGAVRGRDRVRGHRRLHAADGDDLLRRCWASRCGCGASGSGMTMMPSMAAAYQTLERAAVPRATSTINIIRTIGGSFGTAVLTVVLQRRIVAEIPGATGDLGALARRRGAGAPSRWRPRSGTTFWVAVGLTALALIPAWFLPRHPPSI